MLKMPLGSEDFDEGRFRALLDLAGPEGRPRLVLRLDEDLTRIAQALRMATDLADRQAIQAQCHKLIGLAGTIGANRLHDVSVRLHQLAEGPCGLNCADLAREVQAVLGRLIQRIGVARAELAARP